jgi:hypothetical protein
MALLKRVILSLALCIMVVGCKTTYVPIEKEVVKYDSIYIHSIKVDSVKEVDSVFVNTYIKGDTIFQDKYKYVYRYKDKLRIDTMLVERVDSVYIEKPVIVEKQLSWWQKTKQDIGGIAIGVAIALLLYLAYKIYRRFKV